MRKNAYGFTIVELLIVIVVIAILATISIVAYNGIQNRAHDSSVQQDLRNLGQKILAYQATEGVWPTNNTVMARLGLAVSKDSYGHHYVSNGRDYNLVFCRHADGTGPMALVARSKSGATFAFRNGAVSGYSGRWSSSNNICTDAGAPMANTSTDRDWLLNADEWKSYL